MTIATSKRLQRRLRQVFLWPLEALFCFGLFYFARLLPTTFASAAMAAFLSVFAPLTPWHTRARRNLAYAMPALDEAEIERILNAMWRNIGRVIGEYPHINAIVEKGWVEFVGLEHLKNLTDGGFLIGAHVGNWEFGPFAALTTNKKVAAIYRPLNNPLLSSLLHRRQET